jgi:hypothetical protein
MNETNFEASHSKMDAGNRSSKVTIAAIFGAVLITFIMVGCFLTALVMILDAIPFQHLVAH